MSGGASSFERIKQFSQPADRDAANSGNLAPVLNNVGYVRSPGQLSCAEPLLQPGDLRAHLPAELGVEVGQRLVM